MKTSISPDSNPKWISYIPLLLLGILAVAIRLVFFPHESGDFTGNLQHWFLELRESGFKALASPFYDYTPPYMYLLYIGSLLTPNALLAIKVISLLSDVFLILQAFLLLRPLAGKKRAVLGAALLAFLPTVVLNSAMWGQCDAIYTGILLLSLRKFMEDRAKLAWVFLGLAFAFKLQTVFLALLPIIYYWKKKHHPGLILLPALIYFVLIIPVWMAGRPLPDLLTIYLSQSGHYQALTLHAPNVYQLFGWADVALFTKVGILFTAALLIGLCWFIGRKKESYSSGFWLELTLLSVLIIPYFLPGMHERYFYLADVLSVLVMVLRPRLFYITLLIQLSSLLSYMHFLIGGWVPIEFKYLALAMGFALVAYTRYFFKQYQLFPHDRD